MLIFSVQSWNLLLSRSLWWFLHGVGMCDLILQLFCCLFCKSGVCQLCGGWRNTGFCNVWWCLCGFPTLPAASHPNTWHLSACWTIKTFRLSVRINMKSAKNTYSVIIHLTCIIFQTFFGQSLSSSCQTTTAKHIFLSNCKRQKTPNKMSSGKLKVI